MFKWHRPSACEVAQAFSLCVPQIAQPLGKTLSYTFFALFLVLSACSRPTTPAAIRVGFPTIPDIGDVPVLLALDDLRVKGYQIQTTNFASPDLAVAALADGKIDIGNGSTRTHWAAIAKGAPIVTLMEQTANLWSLVATREIKTCADLAGKRIAVNSAGAVSNALLEGYIRQNCPQVKSAILFISGSDNRAAALMSGEIDGALLELSDVMELDRQARGKFHSVVDYHKAFPELVTTGIHANRDFADSNSQQLRDYMRAALEVHRRINADPAVLAGGLVKYRNMKPEQAAEVAALYCGNNLWDVNGGLTADAVRYSVDFFVRSGSLPENLAAEQVADLSYLAAITQ